MKIMYNPSVPEAEYVELYNASSKVAFDLSGWQLQGLSYTFPPGSLIGTNSFLVLAANGAAFAAAYGATNPVFDTFSGTLQPGQTLALVQPGSNGSSNLTVTAVQYNCLPPWAGSGHRQFAPTHRSAPGQLACRQLGRSFDNCRLRAGAMGLRHDEYLSHIQQDLHLPGLGRRRLCG